MSKSKEQNQELPLSELILFSRGPLLALKILYQDEHYVAVLKPSGMMVHHNGFDRHSPVAVQTLRQQLGQRVYPVHRLDRATSGVLVFALSSQATAKLAHEFQSRAVHKTYLAIVRGHVQGKGLIDRPITLKETKQEQAAQTRYGALAKVTLPIPVGAYPEARYSLVAVRPITGRRHQIRRHLRSANHPIIGDTRLGDSTHNRLFREHFSSRRLLLSARAIEFRHPITKVTVQIVAPVDGEFTRLGEIFGWGTVLAESKPWEDGLFMPTCDRGIARK